MSETLNMNGLCRCCLSEGEFRSLDAPYECDGNHSHSALLRETFNITISPMPGPDNASTYTICDRCTSQLQDATQFRNQVFESEKKFTAYVENYLRGDNALSADKIQIEAETLQDEQIEYTLSTYIVKEEIENDLAIKEEIEHTSKEVVETDNAMAISPDDGNDYVNEFDYKIDVCDDDNRNGDERYPCDICNENFRRKDKLRSHVLHNHIISQDSQDFSCPSSDITFNSHEIAEYHCAFCTNIFPTLNSLKTHELTTHTKKSGYICDYCQKSFKLKNILKRHIYLHTGKYKKYICETCGLIARQPSELKVHIKNVHEKIRPFKCDLCPKTYVAKRRMIEHRRLHTGELPYKCDVCSKRFRSNWGFNVHTHRHLLKTVGPSTPRRSRTEIKQDQARTGTEIHNECPICGKRFVYKSILKQHLYCHTKPFKCHFCGEGFSANRRLRRHMLKRHDSSKEKQETNATKANLKYHKGGKHGNIVDKSIDEDVYNNYDNGDGKGVSADDGDGDRDGDFQDDKEIEAEKKPETKRKKRNNNYNRPTEARYCCDFCKEIFYSKDKLHSHVLAKHMLHDSRHFPCPSCGITFRGRKSCIRHMMRKHIRAEYHCAFCIDTFPTLNSLITHELTHTKKSGYICDYCQKGFKHKKTLKRHINHHTGNYKEYICETCGYVTKYVGNFNLHRSVHEKIRPFKCDLCPKSYKFKKNLIDHRRVHAGELPFKCNVCLKHFRRISSFIAHKNRHLLKSVGPSTPRRTSIKMTHDLATTGTEMRPENSNNECHICGKRFVYKSLLKQHLNTHTKPFKCHVCGEGFSLKCRLRRHMLRRHDSSKEKQKQERNATKANLKYHKGGKHGNIVDKSIDEDVYNNYDNGDGKGVSADDGDGDRDGDFQDDKEIEAEKKTETKRKKRNNNYKRTNEARYTCDFCKEIIYGKDKLHSHVLAKHMLHDSRHFPCPSCGITFRGRIFCIRHMMRKHIRAEYQCAFCIDTFPTLNGVRTHELTHTKKSGYICDYCQKGFKYKPNLKRHINHHTENYKEYLHM